MGSRVEKDTSGRFVLKADERERARQAARERLRQIDPAQVRNGAHGQTLPELREIVADLLDVLRDDHA